MTETYSLSGDFPGGLNGAQFHDEIVADVTIVTALIGVTVNGDVVSVQFATTISGPEKTALDALVAGHTPTTQPIDDQIITSGFIRIESQLADNTAVVIAASDAAGGIDIDAGTGGIAIDTTNTISLDAGAASNFSTSTGDLTFGSAGIAKIDGVGGINIGTDTDTSAINVGTGASQRNLTIGNQTSATRMDLRSGTGGFHVDTASGGTVSIDSTGASSNLTLNTTADAQDLTVAVLGATNSSLALTSSGTSADAMIISAVGTGGGIDVDAGTGGFRLDTSGQIYLASSKTAGGDVTLDAISGGITFASGVQGIAMNSGTGIIGIGHWSAGNIELGTSATARAIIIGNTTGATRIIERVGTGGKIRSRPTPVALSDASVTLTAAQLQNGILAITPTVNRVLTLPDAADVVAAIGASGAPAQVGYSIDFHIINEAILALTIDVDDSGTGVTLRGEETITSAVNLSQTGMFTLILTNVTASSEAYTVWRMN